VQLEQRVQQAHKAQQEMTERMALKAQQDQQARKDLQD